MIKYFLTFLIYTLTGLFVFSQQDLPCGTDVQKTDFKHIQKVLNNTNFKTNSEDSIIPVKFHIIGYSNGNGVIDSIDIFNELSVVNSYYINAGIIFEHCGLIQYIYDDEYAYFEKIVDETICDENDEINILNIYFTPDLYKVDDLDTINLCGYAYLSGLTMNRIIMKNSCSTNSSTLAHEIGHYLSLFHTHHTSFGQELVNGSNCTIAGDLFCDTPADPILSYSTVNQSCVYVGNEQDPLGDYYNPDPTNIMSYSRKNCRDYFSFEQINQINNYFHGYRNYLSCQFNGGNNDPYDEFEFNIYPNPLMDQLTFSTNKILQDPIQITIHDITGKVVFQSELIKNSFIDLQKLNYGLYIITVSYFNETYFKKFLKI